MPVAEVIDERLPAGSRRDLKAKKGLKFVEAGKYLQEADNLKKKEERKLIAGYASGRKTLEVSMLFLKGSSICYPVRFATFSAFCLFDFIKSRAELT